MSARRLKKPRRLVLPDDGAGFVVDGRGVGRLALTDGCSVISPIWRWLTGKELSYVGCCDEHDYAYLSGGSWRDRVEADRRLRLCVIAEGRPVWWAWSMWLAVRIFGSPWAPTPWGSEYRWGIELERWLHRVWSRAIPEPPGDYRADGQPPPEWVDYQIIRETLRRR